MNLDKVPAPKAPNGDEGVRRWLVALVSVVCRYPLPVLILSLSLCGLSVYAAVTRLQYYTQRNDLDSPHKDYQQRWQKYLAEFGDDDDIVVVVRGTDRARMQDALESIAGRIKDKPDLFDRLFYKVDLQALRNRALLFLSTDEIRAIQHHLQGMGPLLEPVPRISTIGPIPIHLTAKPEDTPITWECLSLQTILEEANRRVPSLDPAKRIPADDEQFFRQLIAISRCAKDTLADPKSYRDPWNSLVQRPANEKDRLAEPQYFFNSDGPGEVLAFLLVRPIKEKGSFTAALSSVQAMREIVAATRAEYPGIDFGLTGMPVLETDEMAAADHDTRLASWLAVALVGFLFFLVYRGICYPILTLATLLIGTAWAMGWLTATVGHLNILTATFAVMLIGMGDYGVLWVMRYEQARRLGADVRDALLHTCAHVAVGNITAASTLALAFFAAIFADFQAVAELGWIAGCGVLLCAFACFTVLPATLMLLDRRNFTQTRGAPDWVLSFQAARDRMSPPQWLPFIAKRPGWVLAAGTFLLAVLGVSAFWVPYDHNLLHLQASNLESVKWELILIEGTKGASWHAVSYRDTAAEALALKAKYEHLPEVSMVIEAATLVPADQEAKIALLADIKRRLRNLPARGQPIPHFRPSSRHLHEELITLNAALAPLDSTPPPNLVSDVRQSLTDLGKQLTGTPRNVAEDRLQVFDEQLAGDLAENLHHLRDVATPQRITIDDLPPPFRERYVSQSGKFLLRVFARDPKEWPPNWYAYRGKDCSKECLWDFDPLEHFTMQVHTVDADATGKPFGTVEGLKAMKNGLQRAGIYAFLVIALVLLIDFRSWRNALLALAPLVVGVIFTLGIMGLFAVPLNPANMIAFPLILGVGVDNGVHVLHDYLMRRAEQRSTISYAIGRGVLVKALTTMIGFGSLMISTERGLVGLGFILMLGVGCSMVTALVLLPALLHVLTRDRPMSAPEAVSADIDRRVAA
jgi:hopanoid biosynthesis associated RND transporter like protein HpnN